MSGPIESFVDDPRNSTRAELDEVFRTADPLPIDTLVNEGGREVDVDAREVYTDEHWRGFFPSDHVARLANRFLPLPVGFYERFSAENGAIVGQTADADEVFVGRSRLREVEYDGRTYGLVTYTALAYSLFYDLLVPVTEDLVVAKAYVGRFPYGVAAVTFGMTRRYGFDFLSATDHGHLWETGSVPEPTALEGTWDVQLVSNAGLTAPAFELEFETAGDGLDGRFEVLDAAGGDVRLDADEGDGPLLDLSNWEETVRRIDDDLLVGKHCRTESDLLPVPGDGSLGVVHADSAGGEDRLCLYYVMTARDEPIGEA